MSSIMRARNGLTGRSDVSEVIGALSRAEGLDLRCSGLDAPTVTRYRASPRQNTLTPTVAPSRASGFVLRRISPVGAHSGDRLLFEPIAGTHHCRRKPLFMPDT